MILVAAFFLGLIITSIAMVTFQTNEEHAEDDKWQIIFLSILGTATWIVASLLIFFFSPKPFPLDNFSKLDTKKEWRHISVGLALSGGGYRAALMHAGVIQRLNEKGVPITHISTVSGGSIIGAFYAAGGSPNEFKAAVIDDRLNVLREIWLPTNLLRLWMPLRIPFSKVELFPLFDYSRINVQANILDRMLLNSKKLKDLSGPRLQICATDLYTGDALGIAQDGVLPRDIKRFSGKPDKRPLIRDKSMIEASLGRIVAASGAFPIAFNPVKLSTNYALADGGLTDNSGVKLLLDRQKSIKDWKFEILIISDGGKYLKKEPIVEGVIDQFSRSIDIIYEVSGWHPNSQQYKDSIKMVFLRPSDLEGLKKDEFKFFDRTGTLTSNFSKEDADKLFRLGSSLVDYHWQKIEKHLNSITKEAIAKEAAR